MQDEKFKDKLLTALQDSEIQSEIRKIIISGEESDAAPSEIGSAKNEELQNKIEELKSELEQMRNENERIHAESELLKQKNQSMAEARTAAEQQCEVQRKELEHQKMKLKQYEEYVAKQAVQLKDIQNEISGSNSKCLLDCAQTPYVLHSVDAGCAFLRNASMSYQCTLPPKIHYTYCSLHGKLFNCTCKSMDEAQRLCEDWLVTQDRCYRN